MNSDVHIEKNITKLNIMESETFESIQENNSKTISKTVTKSARKKKSDREDIHDCHSCSKKYPSLRQLNQHLKTHGPEPFICSQCPKRFKFRKYLTRHVTNVHTDSKKIQCKVCDKMFRWPNKLKDHMRIHTGEKPYKCEVCDKSFTAKYSLQGHMYLHSDEKPYKCAFCEYACRDNSTLRKHQNRHLGLEQVYRCQICKKKMKNKFYLKLHIATSHLDVSVQRVLCDACGRSFTSKHNLAKHIRIMHDKISYAVDCHICGKTISCPQNLKQHMRVHTDLKPFKCMFKGCEKRFKDKSTQKKHYLIHYPGEYKCEECGKRFSRSYRLERHKKVVHGRLRCAQCDYCGDKFYSKNYLIKHIRQKHMKRPKLECDHCGFETRTKPAMARHLKAHYKYKNKSVSRKAVSERVELSENLTIKEEILSDTEAYNEEDLLDIEKHEIEDDKEKTSDNLTQAKDMKDKNGTISNDMLDQLFTQHVRNELEENDGFDGSMDIHAEELCKGEIIKLLGSATGPDLKETRKLMTSRYTLKRVDPNTVKNKITNRRTTINTHSTVTKKDVTNVSNKMVTKTKVSENRDANKKVGNKKRIKEKKREKKSERDSKGVKLKLDVQQCYVCFKIYQTKDDLMKHCQEHFDICSEKMLKKCPFCDFVTKHNIVRHAKLVHKIDIKLKYGQIIDKQSCDNGSRYTIPIIGNDAKEIEVIPSIKNLNKIASMNHDKAKRVAKDKVVTKRKLVKQGQEWMVVEEKLTDSLDMPKFTENDLKSAGVTNTDDYIQKLKKLYKYNKKNGKAILFPCDVCEKICQTLSALTLHKRRHDPNKKPFKKKVWKHKLTKQELEEIEKNKNKRNIIFRNDEAPKPIVNKHKCDPKLKEFYENNIKGGDIDFGQFLKIYNKMSRDNINEFHDLEQRPEYGILKINEDIQDIGKKVKIKLKKRGCLSVKEIKRREELKRKMREKNTNVK